VNYLLTTLGSLGDLHPYIAVGIGLRERGHSVTLATSEIYRQKVEGEGLRFHPLRPDVSRLLEDPDVMRRAMHPRTGTEYVFRRLFLPWLEQSFEDTLEAARGADVLVGHPIAFATRTVAEILKKTWVSIALQPSVFVSLFDPPAPIPVLPGFTRWVLWLIKSVFRRWGKPVNVLRRRLGLHELRNPVLDDMFSPFGTQAWFSHALAEAKPDWPSRTTITGFPFYDKLEPGQGLDPKLAEFLAAGPPPVVFTLGSSAVFDAGAFYTESLRAAQKTACRAVLLVGRDTRNAPLGRLPDTVFVAEYAPYSELFPRAAVTVHQGGVGTTAQALRAGRPMIVLPFSHDQPDNARRVERLGVARVIPRGKYRAERVAQELNALLAEERYAAAAARTASVNASEDGVGAACDGLEAVTGQRYRARD